MMNLQRMIDRVFGESLPISGGIGESIDTAVALEASAAPIYVKLEYQILDYLTDLQGYQFEFVEQSLIKRGARYFDKISIKLTCVGTSIHFYKDYFFDISKCFKQPSMSLIKREW